MKNYKILTNRPELTSEQLIQSLEFNEVMNHYNAYKKALVKSANTKIRFIIFAIVIIILASIIIMYKDNSAVNIKQKPIVLDTAQESIFKVNTSVIDNETKILNSVASNMKSSVKNNHDDLITNLDNTSNKLNDSNIEIGFYPNPSNGNDSFIKKGNSAITKNIEPFESKREIFVDQNAIVYFIRTTGFNGSALAFSAFVDDTIKCKLNNKSYSIHEIPPGRHKVSAQISGEKLKSKSERISIEMEAGKTYYVHLIYKLGWFVNDLYCQELTEESAHSIMIRLKEDQNCY